MSHSIARPLTTVTFVSLTIINYVSGGETVAVTGLNFSDVFGGIVLGMVPASANSLAVPLFPILDAGKIKLFRMVSGTPTEIPTTNALNAVVPCVLAFV